MPVNVGKKFEEQLKKDWEKTIPESIIIRIPDQISKFKGTSSNICDFIAYKNPILYMIEAKSCKGNTFPFTNLRQYDKLLQYSNIDGVCPGVVIWFIERDHVIFVSAKGLYLMKQDNKKSVNIKMLKTGEYSDYIIDLKSTKRIKFMNTDYNELIKISNERKELWKLEKK